MQGEDALIKQRSGLQALEEKKYEEAVSLITEAIKLLPQEAVARQEHAFFLCDRASVYYGMKEYETAIKDCKQALSLKPELALGFFRMGSAQFELAQYDDATLSYEKAVKHDPSLSEQIKIKLRQVNTAKEVLLRKEREIEREREKEEQRKSLEEKKAKEELLKKERAEKAAIEKAEKAQRQKQKDEERRLKAMNYIAI